MKIKSIISHIFLIVICAVFLFPLIWVIVTSLKDSSQVMDSYELLIKSFHFENYKDAWTAAEFPRYFLNSLIVALSVTLGQIFTSVLAGYALARMEFKGRKVVFMTVLATLIIPYHIIVVPLFVLLSQLGWINTYQGLIVPMLANGFGIYLFRQFFMKVPWELEEAAAIDGASRWTTLWKVVFPQALPAAGTLFIFTFVAEWNNLFKWLIFTDSTGMRNVQLGLSVFQEQFATNYVQLMAAVVIITVPVLILFIIGQKKLIRGISFGGIKG
ncbi:MAG: carbohydrate ABC transporter permease [Elusimicrobiota bacterium]